MKDMRQLRVTPCGTFWFLFAVFVLAACSGGESNANTDVEPVSAGNSFAWDNDAFEAYAFTYTQPCGLEFATTGPTTVWVEGSQRPRNLGDRSQEVPSIPDLLGVISSLGDDFELTEFSEGEFGEPERITVERTGDTRPLFCFELADFAGSNRDGEMRLPVPAVGELEVSDDGLQLILGVPSCNGNPTVAVTESDAEVRFQIATQIPTDPNRDDCLDGASIDLAEPLGDRLVIDEVGGRILAP